LETSWSETVDSSDGNFIHEMKTRLAEERHWPAVPCATKMHRFSYYGLSSFLEAEEDNAKVLTGNQGGPTSGCNLSARYQAVCSFVNIAQYSETTLKDCGILLLLHDLTRFPIDLDLDFVNIDNYFQMMNQRLESELLHQTPLGCQTSPLRKARTGVIQSMTECEKLDKRFQSP
jgi:hypothetical protein